MTSTDTNVINSHLTLMASAKLKFRLFRSDRQKMDVSRGVLVQRHGLEENIVVVIIHLLRKVNDLVYVSPYLEGVWIHLLANFALKTLPIEGSHILVLSIGRLLLLLGEHPVLKALEVNQADGTLALASNNQWICWVLFGTPANSALNIVLAAFAKIFDAGDLLSFLEFLVVELLLAHHDLIALEIFDSESNSTKFDSVKFLNLVIVFSGFIFEGPGNKPESVYTFFLLVGSCKSVVQVVALGVLLQETQAAGIWVLGGVNHIVRLVEVNLIIIAYYLTLRLRLQTHLNDVT